MAWDCLSVEEKGWIQKKWQKLLRAKIYMIQDSSATFSHSLVSTAFFLLKTIILHSCILILQSFLWFIIRQELNLPLHWYGYKHADLVVGICEVWWKNRGHGPVLLWVSETQDGPFTVGVCLSRRGKTTSKSDKEGIFEIRFWPEIKPAVLQTSNIEQ